MFIGGYRQIYTFDSLYPIVNYLSPIGPHDCPHPYAVDNHNNLYLMIEHRIIKMDRELLQHSQIVDNPYDLRYKFTKEAHQAYTLEMNYQVLYSN